jgi:hypothetical protein
MEAMFSHRIICLGLITSFGLIVGCSHTTSDPFPATADASAATQPANDGLSPDALAQKVSTYRRDMDAEMSAAISKPAPRVTRAEQDNQPVLPPLSFPPDETFRLSTYPQEAVPLVKQIGSAPVKAPDDASMQASPQTPSNSGPSMMANFPLSLPEGSDQPDAVSGAQKASATESPIWNADQMERKIAQHLRDDPKDLEGQLDYEMLLFIEGQPVPQMSALAGLRSEDREILSAIMDGLSNFRSVVRGDPNALLATKTQPLIDLSDRLRTQAELTLSSVVLCSEVRAFGVYKPVDTGWFKAAREADTPVVVYCQVQNFQSKLGAENQWQTQLKQEMTLYTESGVQVWPDKSQPQHVEDLCRTRRHDLYVASRIAIPHTLAAGQYLLKISITDEQADRIAEATTPLVITP